MIQSFLLSSIIVKVMVGTADNVGVETPVGEYVGIAAGEIAGVVVGVV